MQPQKPSTSQPTVPNVPMAKPQSAPKPRRPQPVARPVPPRARQQPRQVRPAQPAPANARPRRATKQKTLNWWLVGVAGLALGFVLACLAVVGWLGLLYAGGDVLPGVNAFGVDLGGKSKAQAARALQDGWLTGLVLQDGERSWRVDAESLGIRLDATATAERAYEEGRSSGNTLQAIFGTATVDPVLDIDLNQTHTRLLELAPQLSQPAVNAGVRLVNGQVLATPPQVGRQLDVDATLAVLQQDVSGVLDDGKLELVMQTVQPLVVDSSPMVAQASQLLTNRLNIYGYDPIRNERYDWSLAPEVWSQWLVAISNLNSPTGLALALDDNQLRNYLSGQNVGNDRYLKLDEDIATIQAAIAANQTEAMVRVYHHDKMHTVRNGDTFSSLGYDYGIPYPWIQQANPGVSDALSVGQTITIPSPDNMLPLPIAPNKRIVVSISQQRMWAYEGDQIKWEWPVSTGIASSPTAPGIFQIQSHETNAYAANWDLWMPNFMGVYRPVPTSDFMNGFHGFPTRGGSQLLWTNSLGTRVTYGCILVSNTNVVQLYEWAEDGTVVEIQR